MVRSKILLPDGTWLSSGAKEENAIVSVNLTQSVNAGTQLTLGSVCSSMLEASIIAPGGTCTLQAGTEVALYQNEECMGIFILEKPTRSSANMLKLTAYDRISRLDTDLTDWLSGLVGWPYSLYKLAWMVCAQCGLELKNSALPNGDYQVQRFGAQGITGRQLMQWIGQIAGRFCRATPDGKIEFAWYTDAAVTVGAGAQEDADRGVMAMLETAPEGAALQCVTTITGQTDRLSLRQYGKNLSRMTDVLQPVSCVAVASMTKASCKNTYKENLRYTVSCEILANTTGSPLTWEFVYSDNTLYRVTLSGTVGKHSATSIGGKTLSSVALTASRSTQLSLRNFQLEAGVRATAYTPCCMKEFRVDLPQTVSSGSYDWNKGLLTGEVTAQLEPVQIPALEGCNSFFDAYGHVAVSYNRLGLRRNSLNYENFQVTPIQRVQLRMTNEDAGVVYPQTQAGNTYCITGNYLLTNAHAQSLLLVAQTLYEQLKDVTYTPCRFSLPATAGLQVGERVTVTDGNGYSFTTWVMGKTRSGQKDTFQSTGSVSRQSADAIHSQSFEALNGKVMQLRMDLEGLKAENRDAAGKSASLEMDVQSIRAEVSRQEGDSTAVKTQLTAMEQNAKNLQLQVQTIAREGVSRVVTETGFTFDSEGLTVGKTGSDLTNKITQQGMYVVRNDGTTMLRADAAGVVATDVSVGNYLIIGSHARLEDYTDGGVKRTACFYLGG